MSWINNVQQAINYIENNLFGDITVDDVANHVSYSSGYLQKMFLVATQISVREYIKNRRLSIAGQELIDAKSRVIDLALKYGYETPESFSRAFARFHGFKPSQIHAPENQLKLFNPLTIQMNIKGGFVMSRKLISNIETIVRTITHKGVECEVVERPSVIWVGCVGYASNNTDEPDIGATLRRYREELIEVPKQDLINPGWSAAISINYGNEAQACGIMFAQETYSDKQDERYDLLTQPGGLWLRVRVSEQADAAFFGRANHGGWEYFGILAAVAQEYGYRPHPDVHIQVEYHCHAEYNTPPHTNFVYIPIVTA
ncbi:MAG: AraC family transcriptional regulator [Oscillospiraceae bacterium]|jgi:AraC-like DNA-binding protein|nr:AraC family transcriptional regulator [Oscillospiraceae bacterium]